MSREKHPSTRVTRTAIGGTSKISMRAFNIRMGVVRNDAVVDAKGGSGVKRAPKSYTVVKNVRSGK